MSVLAKLLSRAVAPQRCICIVCRDACDRCWCACTWFHGFPEYVWYRLAILVGGCACSHGADFLGAGVGVGRAGLSPVDPDQVVRPALALMYRRRRWLFVCLMRRWFALQEVKVDLGKEDQLYVCALRKDTVWL